MANATPPRPSARVDRLGLSFTWLCGGALAVNLLLTIALLGLIAANGLSYFWPRDIHLLELQDGSTAMGEIHDREEVAGPDGEGASAAMRIRLKVGNRDLYGADFRWIDESSIDRQTLPRDAMLLERLEWGNFYGRLRELRKGDEVLASGPAAREAFLDLHPQKLDERADIRALETGAIGDINYEIEKLRLAERRLSRSEPGPDHAERSAALAAERKAREAEYDELATELFARRQALAAEYLVVESADGRRTEIPVGEIVRAVFPNDLTVAGAIGLYFSRVAEFILGEPRESNTEGGIFPAIFGTVLMVFLMSVVVAPLGVLAALYLREYAQEGLMVQIVRIAVNNLAGVPSIVFGVFGLGFFVYMIGGSIDELLYADALPTPTYGTGGILWAALTLALLTVPVVIVATEEGLAAVPKAAREGSLALGATKFETTWRVVLPAATPGILTGMILAMARAAGEVAPLMIVGMVKLAPSLPIDHQFPFVHLERKFMHLGFHIYDVGFQSPNVEATQPLVFATALLLVMIVTAMNLVAIMLRNRLRAKYGTSAV